MRKIHPHPNANLFEARISLNYCFIWCNEQCRHHHECDLKGQSIWDYTLPEYHDELKARLDSLLVNGTKFRFCFEAFKNNGTFVIDRIFFPIRNEHDKIIQIGSIGQVVEQSNILTKGEKP